MNTIHQHARQLAGQIIKKDCILMKSPYSSIYDTIEKNLLYGVNPAWSGANQMTT